jgi:hypothetical protein
LDVITNRMKLTIKRMNRECGGRWIKSPIHMPRAKKGVILTKGNLVQNSMVELLTYYEIKKNSRKNKKSGGFHAG